MATDPWSNATIRGWKEESVAPYTLSELTNINSLRQSCVGYHLDVITDPIVAIFKVTAFLNDWKFPNICLARSLTLPSKYMSGELTYKLQP